MAGERPVPEALTPFTSWLVVAGVLLLLLGLCAMFAPALAAFGFVRVVGSLLTGAGLVHALAVLERAGMLRTLLQALSAVVFAAGGLYLVAHPALDLSVLAAVVALTLAAGGGVELANYRQLRGEVAAGWFLGSAVSALLLGAVVALGRTRGTIWGLGSLLGITLIAGGMARAVFAHVARDVRERPGKYRSRARRAAKQRAAGGRPAARAGE